MSTDGQGTKRQRNIAENFNRLSRAHERYRQMTDGWAIAYSEREHEFTFANYSKFYRQIKTAILCVTDVEICHFSAMAKQMHGMDLQATFPKVKGHTSLINSI